MNKVKPLWSKTAGYKTKSGGALYILFKLFQKLFPEALSEDTEQVVTYTIELLILTGIGDWTWRNRKKIWEFIKSLPRETWGLIKTKPKEK